MRKQILNILLSSLIFFTSNLCRAEFEYNAKIAFNSYSENTGMAYEYINYSGPQLNTSSILNTGFGPYISGGGVYWFNDYIKAACDLRVIDLYSLYSIDLQPGFEIRFPDTKMTSGLGASVPLHTELKRSRALSIYNDNGVSTTKLVGIYVINKYTLSDTYALFLKFEHQKYKFVGSQGSKSTQYFSYENEIRTNSIIFGMEYTFR